MTTAKPSSRACWLAQVIPNTADNRHTRTDEPAGARRAQCVLESRKGEALPLGVGLSRPKPNPEHSTVHPQGKSVCARVGGRVGRTMTG